jgi:pimeloyl-ACP methyl ester carboxylesterase
LFDSIVLQSGERIALDFTPPVATDAPWLVFLHGLGSNRKGEKALFFESELTARGYGFARFDFRGHGDSAGKLEQLTITRLIEDLRAVLQRLEQIDSAPGQRRSILIGSSLGALASAWLCALQPGRVVAQALIAPAFRMVERMLKSIGESGRDRWQELGFYHFVSPWIEFDLRYELVTDSKRYPPDLLATRTTLPTLVLHGSGDSSVPIGVSEDFVNNCPKPRPELVRIEGGDHRLTEAKELLLEHLLALINQFESPRAKSRREVSGRL